MHKIVGSVAAIGLVAVGLGTWSWVTVDAQENTGVIRGQVTSSVGPEAGVWVIAEPAELARELPEAVRASGSRVRKRLL